MITPILIRLFERELDQVTAELNAYTDEKTLWVSKEGVPAGGNFCLRIVGELQYFLGAVLNDSGYTRNANAEFTLKNVSRQKLLDELSAAKSAVKDTLEQLSKKEMEKEYPIQVFGEPMSTELFLMHLLLQVATYRGELVYHRLSL
ncbi:MAG: DinB superfamily protein [Chitinophagaceae bacterium]